LTNGAGLGYTLIIATRRVVVVNYGAILVTDTQIEAVKKAGLWKEEWFLSQGIGVDARWLIEGPWDELTLVAYAIQLATN